MKHSLVIILFVLFCGSCTTHKYDVCIYGGTSAGVIAAYTAAQSGLDVVVVEPTNHIGGLTTGGLGFTDIGNKQVIKGVAKQFYRKVGAHYGQLEQWIFEPSVADSIMRSYLNHKNITLISGHRIVSVHKEAGRLTGLIIESSASPHHKCAVNAKYFIDCSYEGDVIARFGVGYTVGREANTLYGETLNGVELMTRHQFPDGIDPYVVKGDPSSGLLWGISDEDVADDGTGDRKVQAYNYRICLTDENTNMVPISRPSDYDSTRYELILRLMEAQPEKLSLNDYFIWSRMPNNKTDINNRGGFSSDMIGMNHSYPEGSYALRDSIISAHISYTKGLLWFMGHDSRVPELLRKRMLQWGYPKDEYKDNGNWTPQLYVRESRRMIGEYVATQADCEGKVAPFDGVAMAAYQMDSHNCQRVVIKKNGVAMVKNEGNVEVGGGLPYPISYRSITPKREECANLVVPVCLSASHIAYGSIRMEPVFMVLGQVSAIAVSEAVKNHNSDIQDVDCRRINVIMDEDPYMDGTQPDIVVDDTDSGVTVSGEWEKINAPGGYGLSYYEIKPTAERGSIVYDIDIPSSGRYKVYTYQNVKDKLSSTINAEVVSGGIAYHNSIIRNELNVEGQTSTTWVEIGEYLFSANSKTTVSFNNQDADAPVRADAILLIKQ